MCPIVKYAFHENVRIHDIGWITTKFRNLLIAFDESKCVYVTSNYYFDAFGCFIGWKLFALPKQKKIKQDTWIQRYQIGKLNILF